MKEKGIFIGPKEEDFKTDEQIKREAWLRREHIPIRRETPLLTDRNADYWFERFQKRKQEYQETVEWQHDVEFSYPDDLLIVLFGDAHAGSPYVDYERMQEEHHLILSTPNVRVITVGDIIDGYFWGGKAQMEQIEQTPEQRAFMQAMLKTWGQKNKLLASWCGDHDGWSKKMGVNVYKRIGEELGAYYMEGVGHIQANIGEQTYHLLGSHQFPGSSIYNDAHPTVRASKEIQGAHVYFSAHTHRKAYLDQSVDDIKGGKMVHHIQLGTFKESDEYARKHGWEKIPKDAQGGSAILMSADEHHIQYYRTVRSAIEAYTK